jgi:3-oxoadipate enol-lactonase
MAMSPEVHIHAEVSGEGDGPPVLFLHSLAMDQTIWDVHVDMLGGKYPVVRCDLPGHGASSPVGAVSVEWMADQVASLLDRQAWPAYVVVGLSLGGCVSQALAIRRPDLVAALCLVDTTAWYGADAVEAWEGRAQKARREGFGSLSGFQLDRWFGPEFRRVHPEVGQRLLKIFMANDITSYVNTCRAMGRFDARERLGSIAVPTTVLVGERDPATPVADAQTMAALIPGSSLRIIPGAGHMSPVERPEILVSEIELLHARVT